MKSNLMLFFLLLISFFAQSQKIKVACIGDSVTYGSGINDRENNSYPVQLQNLLGDEYLVENFGFSGATMLKNGHKPYWNTKEFEESKTFQPNVIILHLGLNDQGLNNWPKHHEEFMNDYLDMIKHYRNLESKPKIFICKMTPTFSGHHWFTEGMRENFIEIQSQIEQIAKIAQVAIIDLHEPLYSYPDYFPDQLHPTKEGAAIIAKKTYSAITGDYGGIKVSKLYGEQMVFQRNQPININGTANTNDTIEVSLNSIKLQSIVGANGEWNVEFPAMKAGGPYELKISSKLEKPKVYKEIYIGELWLASGQSNMDFKLRDMKSAEGYLKDSINPKVFVFSMDPKVLNSEVFTPEEFKQLNASDYFKYSNWTNNDREQIESFSAIAYVFANRLQKQLNVPIGIVCNAVGGSPIQSWISRNTMELDYTTVTMLNDTWKNPMSDSWDSNRKVENFNFDKKNKHRHPYDPTFLFDSGIRPLKNMNFKGVIWYQGESNAEHPFLYTKLFQMLVKDWRSYWNNENLPFYYVQLSSIERPGYGLFRDVQRKLLSIPNTSMAVSSDLGHKTDIHPKQKWPIGDRLAKIALAETYQINNLYSGPLFDYTTIVKNKISVHFKYSQGLKTSDDEPVKDLQIAGSDGLFVDAKSKIKGTKLIIWSPKVKNPRLVRYGYSSFTNGNLVNKVHLPASTFSN